MIKRINTDERQAMLDWTQAEFRAAQAAQIPAVPDRPEWNRAFELAGEAGLR